MHKLTVTCWKHERAQALKRYNRIAGCLERVKMEELIGSYWNAGSLRICRTNLFRASPVNISCFRIPKLCRPSCSIGSASTLYKMPFRLEVRAERSGCSLTFRDEWDQTTERLRMLAMQVYVVELHHAPNLQVRI